MSVYVDQLFLFPTRIACFKNGSCHLEADSVEELHEFAAKLGMLRAWFQPQSSPHYDLTPSKRALAVRLGAVETTGRERAMVRLAAREGVSLEEYKSRHEEAAEAARKRIEAERAYSRPT